MTFTLGTNQFSLVTHICLIVHQDSQVLLVTPGSTESVSSCLGCACFDSNGADCVSTPSSVNVAQTYTHTQRPRLTYRWVHFLSWVMRAEQSRGSARHVLSHLLPACGWKHSSTAGKQPTCSQASMLSSGFGHYLRKRSQMCVKNHHYQGIDQESLNFFCAMDLWQFGVAYGFLKKSYKTHRITKSKNYIEISSLKYFSKHICITVRYVFFISALSTKPNSRSNN